MTHDADCFFFIDTEVPEAQRTLSVLCISCHDKNMPDVGWFYRGSSEGYGPFEYKCCACGTMIHQPDEGAEDDQSH